MGHPDPTARQINLLRPCVDGTYNNAYDCHDDGEFAFAEERRACFPTCTALQYWYSCIAAVSKYMIRMP